MRARRFATTKPPIGARVNPVHPLGVGLVACLVFNEGGGVPYDIVTGLPGRQGGAVKFAWTVRTEGVAGLVTKGSDQYVDWTLSRSIDGKPFTIVVDTRCDFRTEDGMLSIGTTGATRQLLHSGVGIGNVTFKLYFDDLTATAPLASDGDRHHMAMRLSTAFEQSIVLNGNLLSDVRTAGGFLNAGRTLTLGKRPDTGETFGGSYNGVWIYDRYLSVAEVASLYRSPWQMISAPRMAWADVIAAVGGGSPRWLLVKN